MALFSQDNNMPTSVLGLAQGLAGNVQRYAGEPLLSSLGMESEIKQITNVIDEVDPSNKQSIMEGFRKVMDINPAYGAEYKKQMLDFADQFGETDNLDSRAAGFAASYQLPDPSKTVEYFDAKKKMLDDMRKAGYSDTPTFRSLNSEINSLSSQIMSTKKEYRISQKEKIKLKYQPVVSKTDASKSVYNFINSPDYNAKDMTTDEKKAFADGVGTAWENYDITLSTAETIPPKDAKHLYSKVMKIPEVYLPGTATGGTAFEGVFGGNETMFNEDNFTKYMDLATGQNNQGIDMSIGTKVKTTSGKTTILNDDLKTMLKYDLIVPNVTVITNPDGTRGTLSVDNIKFLKQEFKDSL